MPTPFAAPTAANTLSTTSTVMPTATASMAPRSMRWGRVLKGTHRFFCHRCNQGFTQKADLTRHVESNCPMLDPTDKKTFDCDTCGAKKILKAVPQRTYQ